MRTILWTILISAMTLPLVAAAGPVVSPSSATVCAGTTVILHAYQGAGGLSDGFPYSYVFSSDTPGVAEIHGFASGSSTSHPDPLPENGNVFVTAIQPGLAHVMTYGVPRATITVIPPIHPVEIYAPRTVLTKGQQVVVTASVPGYNHPVMFLWYRGRSTSEFDLIQTSSDPNLLFVATNLGLSYFTVQVSECGMTSSAEIAIDVVESRRRTAKH